MRIVIKDIYPQSSSMNTPNESAWERIPNDLYTRKFAFGGTPRPTKEVAASLDSEGIKEIDNIFKERLNTPFKKRNKKGTPFFPQALSEIIFNKDKVGVYCFDGLILPEEEYDNLDNLGKSDYTIMFLTEIIKQDVCSVLTSPKMNEMMEMKEMEHNTSSKVRLKQRLEAKANRKK